MAKQKPCVIQGCPALRKKGLYVCSAHATIHNARPAAGNAKGHKYGAIATTVDGVRFDSKAEAAHYKELKLREKAGDLHQLRLQTSWPLKVGDTVLGNYKSDFDYHVGGAEAPSALVVVDVKGMKTPLYRWKKKHFEAQYGIAITEVS